MLTTPYSGDLRSFLMVRFCAFCFVLLSLQANASEPSQKEPNGHSLYFTVTENTRVDNDVVSVTFHSIAQAPTADLVMQEINQKMQSARKALHNPADLQLQTSRYQVNPRYNKDQVITHWQGQQSLTITTQNQAGLPKLLKSLQPHLSYQSMQFYVSDKAQQHAKKSLLNSALKNYQAKAKQIAASFGAKNYLLIETRIDSPDLATPYTKNYLRSAQVMSDSVSPVVETGKSDISVIISGKILIPH